MRNSMNRVVIIYLKLLVLINRKKFQLKRNVSEVIKELKNFISTREKLHKDITDAKKWFEGKTRTIEFLFEYEKIREFIFEKFSELWKKGEKTKDQQIYALITQVSIANAFLAAFQGKWVLEFLYA